MNNKWDRRFIELAYLVSSWSKDPSTQCGAVVTRNNRIVSVGFNGFPTGTPDTEEHLNNREIKDKKVIHAEVNAILFARQDLTDCTIYTVPIPPCSRCASIIIQSGIKRIVSVKPTPDKLERWGDDFQLATDMYLHADISYKYV